MVTNLELDKITIDNIYLYVADAVRWDYLPDAISELGAAVRTIAASTHSPSSFASILTGQYTPRHGVSSFNHSIVNDIFQLTDLPEVTTRFYNSITETTPDIDLSSDDPIYSVLGLTPPSSATPVDDLSSPFVIIERGPGGHAPYDGAGSAFDYFHRVRRSSSDEIRQDYQSSINRDIELFTQRLNMLRDQGKLEDTLVIYASDHGELLGNQGELGHSAPMQPELVYVPSVFIHPSIVDQTITETTFHHVDLLPTLLDAIDVQSDVAAGWNTDWDGQSVNGGDFPQSARPCIYQNTFTDTGITATLHNEGVWDAHGGHVFCRSPRWSRLAVAAGKLAQSAKRGYYLRNLRPFIQEYWREEATFGQPQISRAEAAEQLANIQSQAVTVSDLSAEASERLHDLGYM